jgi:hypothetical protein
MSASTHAIPSAAVADADDTAAPYQGRQSAAGELLVVADFIAHVLHRAHHRAQAADAPDAARTILGLAQLFADELGLMSEQFDRLTFIQAATHEPS